MNWITKMRRINLKLKRVNLGFYVKNDVIDDAHIVISKRNLKKFGDIGHFQRYRHIRRYWNIQRYWPFITAKNREIFPSLNAPWNLAQTSICEKSNLRSRFKTNQINTLHIDAIRQRWALFLKYSIQLNYTTHYQVTDSIIKLSWVHWEHSVLNTMLIDSISDLRPRTRMTLITTECNCLVSQ